MPTEVVESIGLAPAWAGTTAYSVGDRVTNDTPSRTYECTTAGTSAASGGPTGTGTGISDGTVVWDFDGQRDRTAIQLFEDNIPADITVGGTDENYVGEPYNDDPDVIYESFKGTVDFMIDAGRLEKSLPSTVVAVEPGGAVGVGAQTSAAVL